MLKPTAEQAELAAMLAQPEPTDPLPVDVPAVTPGMSYADYDRAVSVDDDGAMTGFVRSGVVKWMQRSPLHARHAHLWPKEPTDAMSRGSAQHMLLFEPENFHKEFIIAPHIERNRKEGRAAWDELEREAAGRTILRPTIKSDPSHGKLDEWREMASAARNHPVFGKMLEAGQPELSAFANVLGVPCKVRADWVCQHDGWTTVVNYKTSRNASWGAFSRDLIGMGYAFADAFYRMVLDAAVPGPERRFVFAVQESYPPYAVAMYELDDEWVEYETENVKTELRRWEACTRSGIWPGYEETINPVAMPGWLADKAAQETDR